MKTSNHQNHARMATVFCVAIAFGTSVWAQSDAGSNYFSEDEVYDRLETIMVKTEEAAKYVAPSFDDAEIYEARERLEFLAIETENNIRYEAPGSVTDEVMEAMDRLEVLAGNTESQMKYRPRHDEATEAVEYLVIENGRVNEIRNVLSLQTGYVRNKKGN